MSATATQSQISYEQLLGRFDNFLAEKGVTGAQAQALRQKLGQRLEAKGIRPTPMPLGGVVGMGGSHDEDTYGSSLATPNVAAATPNVATPPQPQPRQDLTVIGMPGGVGGQGYYAPPPEQPTPDKGFIGNRLRATASSAIEGLNTGTGAYFNAFEWGKSLASEAMQRLGYIPEPVMQQIQQETGIRPIVGPDGSINLDPVRGKYGPGVPNPITSAMVSPETQANLASYNEKIDPISRVITGAASIPGSLPDPLMVATMPAGGALAKSALRQAAFSRIGASVVTTVVEKSPLLASAAKPVIQEAATVGAFSAMDEALRNGITDVDALERIATAGAHGALAGSVFGSMGAVRAGRAARAEAGAARAAEYHAQQARAFQDAGQSISAAARGQEATPNRIVESPAEQAATIPGPIKPDMVLEDGSSIFKDKAKAEQFAEIQNWERDGQGKPAVVTPMLDGAGYMVAPKTPERIIGENVAAWKPPTDIPDNAMVGQEIPAPTASVKDRKVSQGVWRNEMIRRMRGSPEGQAMPNVAAPNELSGTVQAPVVEPTPFLPPRNEVGGEAGVGALDTGTLKPRLGNADGGVEPIGDGAGAVQAGNPTPEPRQGEQKLNAFERVMLGEEFRKLERSINPEAIPVLNGERATTLGGWTRDELLDPNVPGSGKLRRYVELKEALNPEPSRAVPTEPTRMENTNAVRQEEGQGRQEGVLNKPEDEWDRIGRDADDRKAKMRSFLAANRGKPFEVYSTEYGSTVAITPSAKNPGEWQATFFGKDGRPSGDTRYKSWQEAVDNEGRYGQLKPETAKVIGTADAAPDYSKLTIDQLRAEARKRGLDPKGTRAVVLNRLQNAQIESLSLPQRDAMRSPLEPTPGAASEAPPEANTTGPRFRQTDSGRENRPPSSSETSSSPNSTPRAKEPWEMKREDAARAVSEGDASAFVTSSKEDWGGNRGQGKRTGGSMVRGAMADPPKGIRTYTDPLGKLGLTKEERSEFAPDRPDQVQRYAKARAAGFSHDAAMIYSYSDVKDPHRTSVEFALREGRPVPPEVLAEYPELSKPSTSPRPPVQEQAAQPNREVVGGVGESSDPVARPALAEPAVRTTKSEQAEPKGATTMATREAGEVEQSGKQKPKAGHRPFSKADIEARVAEAYTKSPAYEVERALQQIDDDNEGHSSGTGMFSFPGPLPGEVRHFLEGRPQLRTIFRANVVGRKAHGSDYLGTLGDRYFKRAEELFAGRLPKQLEALRDSPDPEHQFLAALYDNLPEGRSTPKDAVKADTLPAGTRFTINGEKFEVMTDKDGYRVLKDGEEYPVVPVEMLDEIPVDKGTMKQGKARELNPEPYKSDKLSTKTGPDGVFGQEVIDSNTGTQRGFAFETERKPGEDVRNNYDDGTAEGRALNKLHDDNETQRMFEEGGSIPFDIDRPSGGRNASVATTAGATFSPSSIPAKTGSVENIAQHTMPMPELVRFARELTGRFPDVNNRLTAARGLFRPEGRGSIDINPSIAADPAQLAKTLAHEIGHLIDYLPDRTLSRGNVTSRAHSLAPIFSNIGQLRKAMADLDKSQQAIGRPVNKEIRQEMIDLSKWWRGDFNSKTDKASYVKYRESARELYADAVSVWLNTPAELKARAPKFYRELIDYLDRKPEVQAAYLNTMDILSGTSEDIARARREDIREGFSRGETVMLARAREREAAGQSIVEAVQQVFWDAAAPVIRRNDKLKGGIGTPEGDAAVAALHDLRYADNPSHVFLSELQNQSAAPIVKAGMSLADAGEYLLLRRIVKERTDIPNPFGHTPETATQQLANLSKQLGKDKVRTLDHAIRAMDDLVFAAAEEAANAGVYNRRTFDETIAPNKGAYAAFGVVDYIEDRMPAGIKQQVGTFKEVANPFVTTAMKTVSLHRTIELNKAKRSVVDFLAQHYRNEVGAPQKLVGGAQPKRARPGNDHIIIMEDGTPVAYEVPQAIAKSLMTNDIGGLNRIAKAMSSPVYKLLHPVYVTLSPAFQARNLIRDFKRIYKNMPASGKEKVTLGDIMRAYKKASPIAWRRAKGEYDAIIERMIDQKALGQPFHSFKFDGEDMPAIDRLMQQHGITTSTARPFADKVAQLLDGVEWMPESARKAATWTADVPRKIGAGMETLGQYGESLPKVASYIALTEKGIAGRRRTEMVRTKMGTPDTRRRGTGTNLLNSVAMYANVNLQGLRADLGTAFGRKSAAGYWWRTFQVDIAPKLLMAGAAYGIFGPALKRMFGMIPDETLANNIVIPLGTQTNDETGETKAVVLRIPHDDVNRTFARMVWHMAKGKFGEMPSDVLGAMPSTSPVLAFAGKWADYARGVNPYDDFRGRPIVARDEWDAGGVHRLLSMGRWQLNQFGVASALARPFTGKPEDPAERTTSEKVVSGIPGLSSFITISNGGVSESEWNDIRMKDQEDARFKLALPDNARGLVREWYRLSGVADARGKDKLDARQAEQLAIATAFYQGPYLHLTRAMKAEKEDGNAKAVEDLRGELEKAAAEFISEMRASRK